MNTVSITNKRLKMKWGSYKFIFSLEFFFVKRFYNTLYNLICGLLCLKLLGKYK